MNKFIQHAFLVCLLMMGLTYQPTAQAVKIEVELEGIIAGFSIIAGGVLAYYGIQALINAVWWTDEAILDWAEKNTHKIGRKYEQINSSYGLMSDGRMITLLQLFGNRNQTWKAFPSIKETIVMENPGLAPLHNTLLNIQEDKEILFNIQDHLRKRSLTNHPACGSFYGDLAQLLDKFELYTCTILASTEYTKEAHQLDKKIDRLKQQKLDYERNQALRDQAHALREKPDVIIYT